MSRSSGTDLQIDSAGKTISPSKTTKWATAQNILSGSAPRLSMSTAVHSIVAINRMDDLSNFADDSFYLNFFCSEITVSQLSMFYNLFQDKMSKESLMVDKSLFQECVVPILTEDQRRGFGGKRFQTLFEKIDANKDGLVSWDDISLFILQGAGTHRTASVAGGSSSFFDLVDNKKSSELLENHITKMLFQACT